VSVPPQEKNHWAPDTVAHDPQNLDQLLYADLTGLGSWSHGLAWSPEQTLTHIVGALEPGSFASLLCSKIDHCETEVLTLPASEILVPIFTVEFIHQHNKEDTDKRS
jgi:hypothetical protein